MTYREAQAAERKAPFPMHESPWTPERIEQLTKLWGDGFSAAEVARKMGGLSRVAVIGKVHRLKLPQRLTVSSKTSASRGPRRTNAQILGDAQTRAKLQHSPKAHGNKGVTHAAGIVRRAELFPPKPLPVARDLPELGKRIKLVDLEPGDCKYCDGDPLTADHSFCGKPVQPGSSWCPEHHRRVFPVRATFA